MSHAFIFFGTCSDLLKSDFRSLFGVLPEILNRHRREGFVQFFITDVPISVSVKFLHETLPLICGEVDVESLETLTQLLQGNNAIVVEIELLN